MKNFSRWLGGLGLMAAFLSMPLSLEAASAVKWQKVEPIKAGRSAPQVWIEPEKFSAFVLDRQALLDELNAVEKEAATEIRAPQTVISLPMPDGTLARFRVIESSVMAPELAAQFPHVKTYRGQGVDDPRATLRFDITPQGCHAQILSPNGAVYLDPHYRGDNLSHVCYYKRDYIGGPQAWVCSAHTNPAPASLEAKQAAGRSGGTLRVFRLAVAATAEYTAFQGGTVPLAQAAIVTAVNRVTGVYENDLAIRLVLVANNSQLIFTNKSTEPYTDSDDKALLGQNQTTVDAIIGSANYDIGHVVGTGGGGLASLGVVCNDSQKAEGETGLGKPTGDAFYIDFVAHEMGHQFGGEHTYNSTNDNCGGGNRSADTAYEPGSGSTIMAYAGICGSDNLQPHSDPYFHFISYEEIMAYISTTTCSVNYSTGNSGPTVSGGGSYTIPASTPFVLTASGSGQSGDTLTYCWEERDLGPVTSVSDPDNGSSPIIRSFNPTTSGSRVFPQLSNLLSGTVALGQQLPTTGRTMRFNVTLRDNRSGAGGIDEDWNTLVTVAAGTGPFAVTSPAAGVTWSGSRTVTWNVAGTASSPISAGYVNILLSLNGGRTFPIVLASGVPNNGSCAVALPDIATPLARIEVVAQGNIFFNVSGNFVNIAPVLYVDGGYTGSTPDGSISDPFRTVTDANNVAQNGYIIRIFSRNYPEALTFSKALQVQATNGPVTIGN